MMQLSFANSNYQLGFRCDPNFDYTYHLDVILNDQVLLDVIMDEDFYLGLYGSLYETFAYNVPFGITFPLFSTLEKVTLYCSPIRSAVGTVGELSKIDIERLDIKGRKLSYSIIVDMEEEFANILDAIDESLYGYDAKLLDRYEESDIEAIMVDNTGLLYARTHGKPIGFVNPRQLF